MSDEIFIDNFVANLNQKVFFTSKEYTPESVQVFKNGILLAPGVDVFITSGNYVELATVATVGDKIMVRGVSIDASEGINPRQDTFFARLGFDFDKERFGEALTVSGFNKSFYESNPVSLRGWQRDFLKTGVYGNFFQNPFSDTLPAIKNNIKIIRDTIEEIIIAATPIYTTSPFTGTQIETKPAKQIPPEKAQIADLRRVSNSAVVTMSEIDKFFAHTDRLSGVKASASADPDYEKAIRVGTNISQLVNAADGIDDFSPILGSFTSLFIKDEVVFYSNGIENFINENNEVININSWDASNYFEEATVASRNWSLANSFYTTNNMSILAADNVASGLFFKPDGTAVYFSGDAGNTISQYSLPQAWNLQTATTLVELNISSTSNPNYVTNVNDFRGLGGIFIRSDGKKLYQADGVGVSTTTRLSSCIFEYDLGDAWNISTGSCGLNQFINVITSATSSGIDAGLRFPSSVYFDDTGSKMFVLVSASGVNEDAVLQYKLTKPWSVNTAIYETKSISVTENSLSTSVRDLKFSYDGKKLFIIENTIDTIRHFSLTNPWDVSNITFVESINLRDLLSLDLNTNGIFFKPEGDFYYFIDGVNDAIYENRILPTLSSLNFSANDANTLITIFNSLTESLSTRRQHDVNYFTNCLMILNDYNKMTQLVNIPNPAAIVMIRDLIGTEQLKNLL